MCVIICCETTKPSLELLEKCERANPDGGGIAWVQSGVVHWKKGIDAGEIYTIAKSVALPIVAHFRIATVGGRDARLCHPFPIERTARTKTRGTTQQALFQNGHWEQWKHALFMARVQHDKRLPDGLWSDTRAAAWLAAIYENHLLNFISGGKFAVLSTRGIKRFGDDWVKYAECVVSNTHFKWNPLSYAQWTKRDKDASLGEEQSRQDAQTSVAKYSWEYDDYDIRSVDY